MNIFRLLNRPWRGEFNKSCTKEDIYYCFRLILGRNPSKEEWHGHQSLVHNNLGDVVATYVSSPEFKNRKLGVLSDTDHELVDLKDYKMYVSPADTAVGSGIYAKKIYEPHVTKAIKDALAPGMVFIDIGANIGYFSMLAAHLVGQGGQVFAFEPSQYNVKLLYLNAELNGFENVEIYPVAVADKRSLFMYDNMASNGVISEIKADITSLLASTLVYSVPLDDLLGHLDRLDAIKIDVEGAEYLALQGAKRLLEKHRPIIFSEFSPPALQAVSKVSAETYLQLLLIDGDYAISILDRQGKVIACQNDSGKVINYYQDKATQVIDIVAHPVNG